jgi:hypothetical protein
VERSAPRLRQQSATPAVWVRLHCGQRTYRHYQQVRETRALTAKPFARHAVRCGVDVAIAQGWEAGGHVRGKVATMPLIPEWSMLSGQFQL